MSLKGSNFSRGSQQPRLINKLFRNYTKLTQKVLLKPSSHLYSNKKKPLETPQSNNNALNLSPSPLRSNKQNNTKSFTPSRAQ